MARHKKLKFSSKKNKKKKIKKTKSYSFYKKPGMLSWIKSFLKWCMVFAIWGLMALIIILVVNLHDMPLIDDFKEKTRKPTVTIKSYDNQTLATYGDIYARAISYDQIPKTLIEAVIATEDRRFFHHFGIDIIGIIRAYYVNTKSGKIIQGGSTITQQLAKMVFLTPERTFKRKLQELVLSMWIEKELSKEDIISLYLNRVYLGSGLYGVDAAAEFYFNKPVENLTITESAMIAGLLKAPSRYDPTLRPELNEKRTKQVLLNMVDAGYLEEDKISSLTPYKVVKHGTLRGSLKNPYFTDWINSLIINYMPSINYDITIITTLDVELQNQAEKAVSDYINKFGINSNISQAALLTLSPDGAVRAMVGGASYNKSQYNRAVNSMRQSGSIFKIFPYLTALESGYKLTDIIEDKPITIGNWKPENFAKINYGFVSIKEAFARSINIPAVILTEQLRYHNVILRARKLGLTSAIPSTPSQAMGTADVNLMEITNAYNIIANGGYDVSPYAILKIIDSKDGTVLYDYAEPKKLEKIIKRSIIMDMLELLYASVNESYATGKRARIFGHDVFGKTGTSQNFNDAWFIGFTNAYTTGIWLGNDDNIPMKKVTGGTIPANIWHDYMQNVMQKQKRKFLLKEEFELDNKYPETFWDKIKSLINY